MAKKHALLIANTEYRDGKLSPMAHPGLAYADLADALKDPARGAFSHVETLVNANLSHVLNTLDRFFSRKPADDILLVYVGGHGFVDPQGELFLALKESDRFRLKSTALMAAVLGMNMDQCPSPHKLLILDCRYHSPYQDSRGNQAEVRIDPSRVFSGRGLPKLILSTGEMATAGPSKPAAPAATSSTQKLQVITAKDFTRTLAETLRTPSSGPGGRSAFTVEDWWNEVANELKSSRAEAPVRHSIGQPPLTVLRGASLPRPELAMSMPHGETSVTMPVMNPEPEGDWSRLSGIFPLSMFAPDFAAPSDTSAEVAPASDDEAYEEPPAARTVQMNRPRGGDTLIADQSYIEGADAETPGTLEMAAPAPDPLDPVATDEPVRRPDATMLFDLRLPPDLSGEKTFIWDRPKAPAPNEDAPPGTARNDDFATLRSRLMAQEEEEKQTRLKLEREEAAQREKLDVWKARWNLGSGIKPKPEEKAKGDPPEAAAAPAEKPKAASYRNRIAALQKTMYIGNPDGEENGEPQPHPRPESQEAASPPPPVLDGLATVVVSKDQFLNTGSHKIPTPMTPGATIMVPKDEFYDTGTGRMEAASGSATLAAEPVRTARPIRGDRKTVALPKTSRRTGGDGNRRRLALWFLAGLVPVGLGLFIFFGAKSGLFGDLGFGEEPAATRIAPPRVAPTASTASIIPDPAPRRAVPPTPPEEEPVQAPFPTGAASPLVAETPYSPAIPPAALPTVDPEADVLPAASTPKAPVAAVAAPRPLVAAPTAPVAPAAAAVPAAPPARRPAPSLPKPVPAPVAMPAQDAEKSARARNRQDSLRAVRAYGDSVKRASSRHKQDSLRALRVAHDSLMTARAQAKQDSIATVRLQRSADRAAMAEVQAARLAETRVKKDSLRASKEAARSEALLQSSINQAMRADAEEMRGLYNRFALGYPGLKGEVVIALRIAPDGEIEKGAIQSSSTGQRMFDQMVLGNVLEWKIRPFKGVEPRTITVAIQFPVGQP